MTSRGAHVADPASRVLHDRLSAQVAELRSRDSAVRRGSPDGVHKMRVSLRRLRAALASFRPLVDRAVTDPVRDELRWAAHALGEARDEEVVHEVLAGAIAALPSRHVVGPVRLRVEAELRSDARAARGKADDALDSERYTHLLESLDNLVTHPPWTEVASRPAREVLPQRLRRDWKRLRRQVAAGQAMGPSERNTALHEVRKAAKRLRYAAEALEPAYGPQVRDVVRGATRVQELLGEHHDTVVARERLQRIADLAHLAGESTLTYARMDAELARRATELEHAFGDVWSEATLAKAIGRVGL